MIPKTIHYCWFGNNPKSPEILKCIESWRKFCPDFSIIEWNENNFAFKDYPFTARMYKEKRWAFVADYARLHILYEQGGFYLDTDMLLLQSLSPLVTHACVVGEESPGMLNAAIMGSEAHHPFITLCKKYYDTNPEKIETIPRVMSKIFETYQEKSNVTVYPPKTFYPFAIENIKEYHGQDLGPEVIGVHLWNYSWGSPLNKLFKKIGIHSLGVKIAESLGIKKFLKKLLGLI